MFTREPRRVVLPALECPARLTCYSRYQVNFAQLIRAYCMTFGSHAFSQCSHASTACVFFPYCTAIISTRGHPAHRRSVRADSSAYNRDTSSVVKKLPTQRHYYIVMQYTQESRRCNAMASYWIRQAQHTKACNPDTSYFWREQQKKRKTVRWGGFFWAQHFLF